MAAVAVDQRQALYRRLSVWGRRCPPASRPSKFPRRVRERSFRCCPEPDIEGVVGTRTPGMSENGMRAWRYPSTSPRGGGRGTGPSPVEEASLIPHRPIAAKRLGLEKPRHQRLGRFQRKHGFAPWTSALWFAPSTIHPSRGWCPSRPSAGEVERKSQTSDSRRQQQAAAVLRYPGTSNHTRDEQTP